MNTRLLETPSLSNSGSLPAILSSSHSSNDSNSLPAFSTHSIDVVESESLNLTEILELADNAWLTDVAQLNPLPKRYRIKSHQTAAIIFAAICSSSASVLYIEGGAKYGPLSVVGGVAVNLTQNILYSMSTYFFLQASLSEFKKHCAPFTLATAIGTITTATSFVSTYYFSEGNIVKAIANSAGNLPMNIFGAYISAQRLQRALNDNVRVRVFLQQKLHDCLYDNAKLQKNLEPSRNTLTRYSATCLGLGVGLSMGAAQAGYLCLLSQFFGEKLKDESAGIAVSFTAMAPILMVAIFISGIDLSKDMVHFVADIYQHITGKNQIQLSYREKKIAAISMLFIGVSTWLALYSSATSKFAFEKECNLEPVTGSFINLLLKCLSDQGAMVFNTIMSGLAINAAFGFYKEAYCADDSDDKQTYQVSHIQKSIQTSTCNDLEKIAREHFPADENQWQKEPSCLSNLRHRFWQKTETHSNYQTLDESKEAEVTDKAAPSIK